MDNFIPLSFRGVKEALNIQRNLLNSFDVKKLICLRKTQRTTHKSLLCHFPWSSALKNQMDRRKMLKASFQSTNIYIISLFFIPDILRCLFSLLESDLTSWITMDFIQT